jgi:hypothetical protein
MATIIASELNYYTLFDIDPEWFTLPTLLPIFLIGITIAGERKKGIEIKQIIRHLLYVFVKTDSPANSSRPSSNASKIVQ